MVTGRLVRNPIVYKNKDGSRKILFTIAARDNYKNKSGACGSQFISLEAFISGRQADNGVYDYICCGDLVCCAYTVQSNTYKNKDGKTVFGQVLTVDEVALLESKAMKEARQAKQSKPEADTAAAKTKKVSRKQASA